MTPSRALRPAARGQEPRGHRERRGAGPLSVALLLLGTSAGCFGESEIGSPLAIELEGPENGQAGEELAVRYSAVGRSLGGIVLAWGDGAVDSVATAGAQSASGTRFHTYEQPGAFLVSAQVDDSLEGVASAELTINIQGSQEPGRQEEP